MLKTLKYPQLTTGLKIWGIFFLAVLFVFSPLLFFPFVYDDIVILQNNDFLRSFDGWVQIWRGHVDSQGEMDGTFRPLLLSFFSLIGWISDFNPSFFRLLTFALHASNGWLLFQLAQTHLGLSKNRAGFLALVFLLHPIQTTSLALVWKQSDLWIGLATFLSLKWIWNSPPRKFSIFFLFFLSLLVKESAIVLPLFWLTAEPFLPKEDQKQRKILVLCGLAFSAIFFFFWLPKTPPPSVSGGTFFSRSQYIWTQLSVLPLYFRNLFFPSFLSIDRNVSLVSPPSPFDFGLGAVVFLLFLVGLGFFLWKKKSKVSLFLVWIFLWLAPTTLQPLSLLYDETRMYLGVGFFTFFFLQVLPPLPSFRPKIILLGVVLFLGGLSFVQTLQWKSERSLWEETLRRDPFNARAHYQLGWLDQKDRALDDAQDHYEKALEVSPKFESAHLNLGILLGQKGNLQKAAFHFQQLLSSEPYWASLGHYHLGLGAFYQNDSKTALLHFQKCRDWTPWSGHADKGEALVFTKEGKIQEAKKAWKRYLQASYVKPQEKEIAKKALQQLAEKNSLR